MDWLSLAIGILLGAALVVGAYLAQQVLAARASKLRELERSAATHADRLDAGDADRRDLRASTRDLANIAGDAERRLSRIEIRLGIGDGIA